MLAKQQIFGILASVKQRRQRVTAASKTRWLLGLLPILFLMQLVIPSRAWTTLFLGLGGTLAFSYLWARQMAGKLSVVREQYYGWVHVGDLLEERFSMHNNSFLPSLWVEIDDYSDLPGYSARSVRATDGHQTVQWRTEGICRQRGLFTLGPWQVRAAATRQSLRYSPTITDNGILIDELTVSVNGRVRGPWRVLGGAGLASFSDDNERTRLWTGFAYRWGLTGMTLDTGYRFDYMDYNEDLDHGYFDPSGFTSHMAQAHGWGEYGDGGTWRFAVDAGVQSFTLDLGKAAGHGGDQVGVLDGLLQSGGAGDRQQTVQGQVLGLDLLQITRAPVATISD